MKPRMFTMTVFAFSLLLGIAQAQTPKLSASIPFDFQVGTQHMPAGQYVVSTNDGYVLAIRALHTSGTAVVLTNSIGSKHPQQESPRFVFLRSGSQYYLAQVWAPDLRDGRKIPLLKNQQIEASNAVGNQEFTIALARH